jgi:hypothetical protein
MGHNDKHKSHDATPRENPGTDQGGSDKPWVPTDIGKGKNEGSQTNQPFEQDVDRRSGQFEGTGEAPRRQP